MIQLLRWELSERTVEQRAGYRSEANRRRARTHRTRQQRPPLCGRGTRGEDSWRLLARGYGKSTALGLRNTRGACWMKVWVLVSFRTITILRIGTRACSCTLPSQL